MAWLRKHAPEGAPGTDGGSAPPPKRRRRRWLRRALLALALLVVAALAAVAGGLYWALQTESGQAWLMKTANAALESKDGGLTIRLTRLSGSLPFDFVFGLEAAAVSFTHLTQPTTE